MEVGPTLAVIGCPTFLFVFVLLLYMQSLCHDLAVQSVELRKLRESLCRRDKHIKALNDHLERPRDAGVCQSVSVHMRPFGDDTKDSRIEQLTEKLRLAEKDYSTRLESFKTENKLALNRRMEGLMKKKAEDDAAKDPEITSRDSIISAKDQEIAELKKELISGRTHEVKIAQVSQRLHGQLTERESQINELRFNFENGSREACVRRDSGLAADYVNLYKQYKHMEAMIEQGERRWRVTHEREMASMSQQYEIQMREREVGLMRARVRDPEKVGDSVLAEDKVRL